MLRSYTHSEMLELWRSVAGLEPLRADCTVEAVEGLDADGVIVPRMRTWYLNLLDTAPAHLLPVADVASECVLKALPGGAAAVELPQKVRRLLRVRLSGWSRAAVPGEIRADTPAMRLNPYCGPGKAAPMCELSGRTVVLRPASASDKLAEVLAVVDPGSTLYDLDESLISSIPDIFENNGKY